jgi:hypothetical protein
VEAAYLGDRRGASWMLWWPVLPVVDGGWGRVRRLIGADANGWPWRCVEVSLGGYRNGAGRQRLSTRRAADDARRFGCLRQRGVRGEITYSRSAGPRLRRSRGKLFWDGLGSAVLRCSIELFYWVGLIALFL